MQTYSFNYEMWYIGKKDSGKIIFGNLSKGHGLHAVFDNIEFYDSNDEWKEELNKLGVELEEEEVPQ